MDAAIGLQNHIAKIAKKIRNVSNLGVSKFLSSEIYMQAWVIQKNFKKIGKILHFFNENIHILYSNDSVFLFNVMHGSGALNVTFFLEPRYQGHSL